MNSLDNPNREEIALIRWFSDQVWAELSPIIFLIPAFGSCWDVPDVPEQDFLNVSMVPREFCHPGLIEASRGGETVTIAGGPPAW